MSKDPTNKYQILCSNLITLGWRRWGSIVLMPFKLVNNLLKFRFYEVYITHLARPYLPVSPQCLDESSSMIPMVLLCTLNLPCPLSSLIVVLSLPLFIVLQLSPGLVALACLQAAIVSLACLLWNSLAIIGFLSTFCLFVCRPSHFPGW